MINSSFGGRRDIPFPISFIPLLEEQFKYYEENKNNLLFCYEGRIIKASTVNTVLKRICKKLKLSSKISNHTLRHTFGTRCIESGMSPVVVQNMMGHKDIRVTLNIYTSVLNQYKQEEFNKVTKYYMDKDLLSLPEDNIVKEGYLLNEDSLEYDYETEKDIKDLYKEFANSPQIKKMEESITQEEWKNYYKELIRIFGNNQKE